MLKMNRAKINMDQFRKKAEEFRLLYIYICFFFNSYRFDRNFVKYLFLLKGLARPILTYNR